MSVVRFISFADALVYGTQKGDVVRCPGPCMHEIDYKRPDKQRRYHCQKPLVRTGTADATYTSVKRGMYKCLECGFHGTLREVDGDKPAMDLDSVAAGGQARPHKRRANRLKSVQSADRAVAVASCAGGKNP